MNSVKIDGQTVTKGQFVCFKSDHEQTGRVLKIKKTNNTINLTLESPTSQGFSGGYIGGQQITVVDAGRCWVE